MYEFLKITALLRKQESTRKAHVHAQTSTRAFIFTLLLLFSIPVQAAKQIETTIKADVLEVIDGDTLRVRAEIWMDQYVLTLVRISGVDAPELEKARCVKEKRLALRAKNHLTQLISAAPVLLKNRHRDKYGGRIVAEVVTSRSQSAADSLIATGLAVPYAGKKRRNWCE